ncbi:MAG TPA: tRNA (adenosine(37)-N6)-dimethylallyltransferase MiaA [Hyphomicrobiaceae bacterium]|nr:tRNA (adenosine(37)-N6)-dimethylallyltransferase MiaA [Hyphomicrobiaceae bacterium]
MSQAYPQVFPDVMPTPRPVLIAGPTASGKSALALALAERLGGTVINADSMQVYRELRLITARPSAEDEARAPHALYGCVSGADAYSAGRYAVDAARAIAEAQAAGRVPIVVGGTGLYFKALLEGLSPIPATDPGMRAYWRNEAARRPAPELHALLRERDPEMAMRLMPTDQQRIVRALEVLDSTGRSLAAWQREPGRPVLREAETKRLLVLPEQVAHRALIEARFDAMLAGGGLDEVRRLLEAGLSSELPVMRALGVAPLAAHLRGLRSLEDAAATAKSDTRKYAKRQLTWLRRNMITWKRIESQYLESLLRHDVSLILRGVDRVGPAR